MSTNWDNPTEMLTKAQTARSQGDSEMAYQFFARASELSPQQVSAWQGRAETATSSDEALVSYAYASALDANNSSLARTLDAALDRRVQSSTKGDVPLLVALGQEFAEVGMRERARTLLERASELDPSSTDALIWLAGTAPDEQSQVDYLNRALAANPRDPRARAGLVTLKLAIPTTIVTAEAETATVPLDALKTLPAASQPSTTASPSADETSTMERLRNLHAQVPANPKSKSSAKQALPPPTDDTETSRATAAGNQTRMRNLMLLLLGVVAVLVLLGIILLQLQ